MMKTVWCNLKLELVSRKRFVSPYLFWTLMSVIAFLMIMASGGGFKGANVNFGLGQKVAINSPTALLLYAALVVIFGLLIISPIYGQAICKDFENKFDAIVLATPADRTGLYLGRFLGATLVCFLIFSGIGLALYLASASPWVQASLFGPNRLDAYLAPYLIIILPNIVIFGSIAFAVGAVSKRMAPVYIAGIFSFMGYLFGGSYSSEIDHKTLRALIDPFGINAIAVLTEYWSVPEQNQNLVPFSGVLLWNRLLWLGFSSVLLSVSLYLAQRSPKTKKVNKKSVTAKESLKTVLQNPTPMIMPSVALDFSRISRMKLLWTQTLFEAKSSLKNVYFLCLTLAGVVYVFSISSSIGKMFGTETYPVTWKMLSAASGNFGLFIYIIIIFYVGELLWRERSHRMNQIFDALPTPVWISSLAKFLGMQIIVGVLLLIVAFMTVTLQLAQGYTKFEWSQIFYTLYTIEWPSYLIFSALFFFVHALVNNKFLGHGICIAYLILMAYIPSLGFERVLYRYGAGAGSVFYSDMNGYGPLLTRTRNLQLYWGLGAIFFIIGYLLFSLRGTDSSWSIRIKEARSRFKWPLAAATALVLIGFAAQGVWVHHNTAVLNIYKSQEATRSDQVYFEKTYKAAYDRKPQVSLAGVKAQVDIFPSQTALKAKMNYRFENRTNQPIAEIFIGLPLPKKHYTFVFDREASLAMDDTRVDVLIYKFATPVAPGEGLQLDLTVDYAVQGFKNNQSPELIVKNGTFFNQHEPFPSFGYNSRMEISTDKQREKFGLAPKLRMNPIGDEEAKQFNYLSDREGDWIDFEATVSTDSDQIAIAPGYLQREWQEAGRRYFHYTMDQKILYFFSFLSARYESKKDKWQDVDLEILYHKGHEFNVDSMLAASKHGLEYFTKHFGPYQHKQFRIIEFPRYATFAQAFPNTIPYSEAIGFVAKVDPKAEDDLDYPYYVTAHELAHQWWAHQVIGANVQGATMLSETLSQYSALMVMEEKFGRAKMGRFLKHEMDSYLGNRSAEVKTEQPLSLNENQQYIHYNKGSLAMYALKEVIGEQALNGGIRAFLEKVKYQKPPFTTSLEFIATLKENIAAEHHPLIDDMLGRITLYDNRILKAEVSGKAKGEVDLTLEIKGRKSYVDSAGDESDGPLAQNFTLTVKDKDDKVLLEQKTFLKSGDNSVKLTVKGEPAVVHLDELGIWIDKVRDDNKFKL